MRCRSSRPWRSCVPGQARSSTPSWYASSSRWPPVRASVMRVLVDKLLQVQARITYCEFEQTTLRISELSWQSVDSSRLGCSGIPVHMLAEERRDEGFPLLRTGRNQRRMSDSLEQLQLLIARQIPEDRLDLRPRDPGIDLTVQQQDGAGHIPGIVNRIVPEAVKTMLETSPEHQARRCSPGRNAHRGKAILHRGEQSIKWALQDQRSRLNPLDRESTQNRGTSH